ncbi:MAG: aldo/keto reductase [Sedimentisphaerales bacterium]|nr:aldo/keto reductase [Sedimentisphaerales bacterium]
MRTRRLGNTDLELTVIGMGTWAIGGPWEYGWGPQNDQDSIGAILAGIEAGINWIDTAPAYGCGHGEEVVGRALRQMREKPILATKCGLTWDDKRRKVNCLDHDAILAEADACLVRLGVEVIDLWQLHWPWPDEQLEEAWEAMAKTVEQGKVRYLGASNFTVDQLRRVAKICPPVSLQPPYSMIDRRAEVELFEYCRKNQLGIVCYSPMQKGLLTGKYTEKRVAELAPDDHRRRDPNFNEKLKANLALVERLRPIALRHGRTPAQLAIAWVLRLEEVTAAIVGARNETQIAETIPAGDWILSREELDEIEELLAHSHA